MSEETLEGRCMCGAVKLTVRPKAPELHACHCSSCRRWTGSAFVEFDVAPQDLAVEGPVKSRVSSNWAERAWCDDCGSVLWYHLTVPGQEYYAVSAGLFPNSGGFELTKEIYIDRKPDGYRFAGKRKTLTKHEVEALFASSAEGEPQ
ncbi:GFA family protein [Mangrovicoccus ximenensis]|uniref:GFA family protein n=1 Tax=Mangrovicoccus ximenensis TaxID=1911570 RepID=UPI000D3C50A1|nr:GFA family protein [Mangrovicoccus ximenensis]